MEKKDPLNEIPENTDLQSKCCSGKWWLCFWQMRVNGSVNGEKMKFRSSFSQLLHYFTFSRTNTSEWEGVEMLQLCMMFETRKKRKGAKGGKWELDSSGFYSVWSKDLNKPQYLLDYWAFVRRRQYNSAPSFRIGLLWSTHVHPLTKSYIVSNFYFDLIIFKVLQSMGW